MIYSKYKLFLPPHTLAQIRHLHPTIKKTCRSTLEIILTDPFAGKELTKELTGFRSYAFGRYRIIYELKRRLIRILLIGHRATIYEEMLELLQKTRTHH
ncbi:MAG TPA: cytotoxin [Deltaproteobacteria bacterium]|nr:cytotoxin [Deltaproteobacteria bacterium]